MKDETNTHSKTMRRTGVLAIAALSTICLTGLVNPVAANAAVPPQEMKAAQQELNAYGAADSQSYWTMAPGNNCTNYVAWRLIQDGMSPGVTWLHNGGDWAAEARAHRFPVNHTPTAGSVAQWSAGAPSVGSAGHVAYVEAVYPNAILVTEDNYSSGPRRVRVISKSSPEWPTTFIHFIPTSSVPTASAGAYNAAGWKLFVASFKRAY